jgi:hypothetical protein
MCAQKTSRYFPTVRGEIRMPSFTDSSSAILSSPQLGFSWAICRTSFRIFFGSAGRPRLRDFHRQNIRNAVRCHLMNVSDLAIAKALRQSKNLASATIARRNEAVVPTIRREFLDHLLFWSAADLETKLHDFQDYYDCFRTHSARARAAAAS